MTSYIEADDIREVIDITGPDAKSEQIVARQVELRISIDAIVADIDVCGRKHKWICKINGLRLVTRWSGFRGPAAAQILERRLRVVVARPKEKASGCSLIRSYEAIDCRIRSYGSEVSCSSL